jgi:hypothetical protein
MNARILTAATVATAFAVVLPAQAADSQLLNLVMPDAVVVSGANVAQAKTSPFGQYVLAQIQSQDAGLQKLIAATGFDPTQDVSETLAASNGTPQTGLLLARGTFDAAKFAATASTATKDHAVLETYGGVTIIEDPKQTFGFAFPSASIAVAGDLADVKAALDRVSAPSNLPAALVVQINQWSGSEDAWAITTVPLSSFQKGGSKSAASSIPGLNGQGIFQAILSAAGGVKFGANDVITGQAQADSAQDAQSMADALKLLASLAQLQASKDPAAAALAQSLQITASGATLTVTVGIPESTLEQLLVHPNGTTARKPVHRM